MAVVLHPSRSGPWHSAFVSKLKYILMTDSAPRPCCVTVDPFHQLDVEIWICKKSLGNKKLASSTQISWKHIADWNILLFTEEEDRIMLILLSLRSFLRIACCWDVFQSGRSFLASLESHRLLMLEDWENPESQKCLERLGRSWLLHSRQVI